MRSKNAQGSEAMTDKRNRLRCQQKPVCFSFMDFFCRAGRQRFQGRSQNCQRRCTRDCFGASGSRQRQVIQPLRFSRQKQQYSQDKPTSCEYCGKSCSVIRSMRRPFFSPVPLGKTVQPLFGEAGCSAAAVIKKGDRRDTDPPKSFSHSNLLSASGICLSSFPLFFCVKQHVHSAKPPTQTRRWPRRIGSAV